MTDPELTAGTVVAAFGRRYLVEAAGGELLDCVNRGKKGGLACGDGVELCRSAPGQGVIERRGPRRSLLYRSDARREKLIAANVDQALIVVTGAPLFSEELLNRCLAAAEAQHLAILILLNKADLEAESRAALALLAPYRALGYAVLPLSARHDVAPLLPWLSGRSSVLVGQSGMGKSTLINALVPQARAATAEVSAAHGGGRHTTTAARLYRIDAASAIIDSPGMQEFGLHHLGETALAAAFVEFRPHLGHCRFGDCRHLSEPGCALAQAAQAGAINPRRLEFYRRMLPMAKRHR